MSETTKNKMSKSAKNRPPISETTREKLRNKKVGHSVSKQTRDKISLSLIGRGLSKEHKRKLSELKKGKKNPEHSKRLKGKRPSLETRKKMSLSHSGHKAPNWKGGITPINKKIRGSIEYRLWREAVFERDNWTCVWCGARNGNGKSIKLNADHIKPFALFPELRFAIDNGRTLCVGCHIKTPTFARKTK